MLDGKIIVVTGAFGVLGSAVCALAQQHGARVACIDKADAPVAADKDMRGLAIGGVDLADRDACAGAFERVAAHFGALDGLVNVAGGFRWEAVEGGAIDTWDAMYAINVRTAAQASMAALPLLLERGGRIVNIGSLSAQPASTGMAAYAASKAGVARLTEAMAAEFGERGMNVNAVLPGIIDTPANRTAMPNADFGRWVAPAALAEVILFLLSPAGAAVNGALIPVRGRMPG